MVHSYQTPEPSETDEGEYIGDDMNAHLDEEEDMVVLETEDQIEAFLNAAGGDDAAANENVDIDSADVDDVMEDSGLIDPPRDDASLVLNGHSEGVFAVCIDKNAKFLASGSQDHSAIIWDLSTGNKLFCCPDHEDSVTCVSFSADGRHLATGDMSGLVQVWTPGRSAAWDRVLQNWVTELQWLHWHPVAGVLIAGAGGSDGSIAVWSLNVKHTPKYLPGVGGACLAGEVHSDGQHLYTLYETGQLRLWNLKTEQATKTVNVMSPSGKHESRQGNEAIATEEIETAGITVVSMAVRQPDAELVAIGAQSVLILVHLGQRSDIQRIEITDDSTIEAVGFSKTHPFLAFGTVNGLIGVFDLNSMQMRAQWRYNNEESCGISRLVWSPHSPIFFTTGLDARLVAWDARSSAGQVEPLAVWFGHRAMLLDCQLYTGPVEQRSSSDDSSTTEQQCFVVTGSDDASVRLFDVKPVLLNVQSSKLTGASNVA